VILAPSTQDRKVPSMPAMCTGVTCSTNSWQRCPPGPPRSAHRSGLRAGRAALGTPFPNRCPWVRQREPRQPAIGKRPALGDRGASVPGASARSQRPRPKLSESSPDSPMAIPTALRWVCLASLRAERRSACVSSVAWARLSGAARFSAVEPAGHGGRPTSTQREAPRPVTWAGPSLMSLRGPTSRLARVAVRDGA
jgi:hypothetical protein